MPTRRLLLPVILVAGLGIAACSGGHDMDNMGPGEEMPTTPGSPSGAPAPAPAELPAVSTGQA